MASCSYCPAVGLYKWRDKFACRKHMPLIQVTTKADHLARCARAQNGFNAQWAKDSRTVLSGGAHSIKLVKMLRVESTDPARHAHASEIHWQNSLKKHHKKA